MLRRMAAALLMVVAPAGAGAAEAEVLAEYWARSGTVAPPYAWSVTAVIREDGSVRVTRCKGYDTEGPNCLTSNGHATADMLQAIRAAVAAQGLVQSPAREATAYPIGGGSSGATVHVGGKPVVLPPFPAEADVPRVQAVMAAIAAAIPGIPGG